MNCGQEAVEGMGSWKIFIIQKAEETEMSGNGTRCCFNGCGAPADGLFSVKSTDPTLQGTQMPVVVGVLRKYCSIHAWAVTTKGKFKLELRTRELGRAFGA